MVWCYLHKDLPISQWMIIKIRYNVCVKHVVAVCWPITSPSWNEFLCHQTRMRPSTSRNNNILPYDKWPPFQFRLIQRIWSLDQLHLAHQWRNDIYVCLMGKALLNEPSVNSPYKYMLKWRMVINTIYIKLQERGNTVCVLKRGTHCPWKRYRLLNDS